MTPISMRGPFLSRKGPAARRDAPWRFGPRRVADAEVADTAQVGDSTAAHATSRPADTRPSPDPERHGVTTFSSLVSPADVLLDLDVANAQALFRAIGSGWERVHGLTSEDIAECLQARETLGSTGLGEGVAIPHARIKGLSRACGAVARLRKPIPFMAPDSAPVDCFLVLLVPEAATEQHLQMLGDAAEMLARPRFRSRLKACTTPDEVVALLNAPRSAP